MRRVEPVKVVTWHALRHFFVKDLFEVACDIRTVQELLEHKDVSKTLIYTTVMNRGPATTRSPVDRRVILQTPGPPPPPGNQPAESTYWRKRCRNSTPDSVTRRISCVGWS